MIENKSLSLEEQVFRTLEEEIISGVYAAGESLTELGLSAKLGVSRTPFEVPFTASRRRDW